MLIFAVFTLAGIGLFISEHRGWGSLCLVIAVLFLLARV
jgi:hypothetical protein